MSWPMDHPLCDPLILACCPFVTKVTNENLSVRLHVVQRSHRSNRFTIYQQVWRRRDQRQYKSHFEIRRVNNFDSSAQCERIDCRLYGHSWLQIVSLITERCEADSARGIGMPSLTECSLSCLTFSNWLEMGTFFEMKSNWISLKVRYSRDSLKFERVTLFTLWQRVFTNNEQVGAPRNKTFSRATDWDHGEV